MHLLYDVTKMIDFRNSFIGSYLAVNVQRRYRSRAASIASLHYLVK